MTRSNGSGRRLKRSTKSFLIPAVVAMALVLVTFTLIIALRAVDDDDDDFGSSSALHSKAELAEDGSLSAADGHEDDLTAYEDDVDGDGELSISQLSSPLPEDPSHGRDSVSRSPDLKSKSTSTSSSCATVEEMGKAFGGDGVWKESLRVRKLIRDHFEINGASRIRNLPPERFCKHNFVLGKTSEAGFGNEIYKLLTAASLSIMLNRSLIIGQTRHIGLTLKPFNYVHDNINPLYILLLTLLSQEPIKYLNGYKLPVAKKHYFKLVRWLFPLGLARRYPHIHLDIVQNS